MVNKILSSSDSMKGEYCCSVVKIGELKPIDAINAEIKEKESKADEYTQRAIEKNVTYNNLKASIERINEAGKPIVDKAKKLTGFFWKIW